MREYGFSLILILPYKTELYILSLHGRIRASEIPYSPIFYVVKCQADTFEILPNTSTYLIFITMTQKKQILVFNISKF